jgi:hypothetical protein
VMQAQVLQTL